MKNLILATVSGLALLATPAFAAEEAAEPTTSNEAAAMAAEAAKTSETAAPTTSDKSMAQTKKHMKKAMKPKAHHPKMAEGHHPKLTARHYMQPHHMKHSQSMHQGYPMGMHPYSGGYAQEQVIIDGHYIAFPPMDMYGRPLVAPKYYRAKQECPYVCHGGYFWYPHVRANLLNAYKPYKFGNYYWYASYMHPHMVYTERTHPAFVYPYPLDRDSEMYMMRHQGQ